MEHGDVVTQRPQPSHRAFHLGDVHQQIGDQHDHAATVDEPSGLGERLGRARRESSARLLERGENSPPMSGARAWRNRAPDTIVVSHQPHRVALPNEQERKRSREDLGVREFGQPGRRNGGAEGTQLGAAPGHGSTDVEHDRRAKVGLLFVLTDHPSVGASRDLPVDEAEIISGLVWAIVGELHREPLAG